MAEDGFSITGDELVALYSSAFATLVAALDLNKAIDGKAYAEGLALGPDASPAMVQICGHLKSVIEAQVDTMRARERGPVLVR